MKLNIFLLIIILIINLNNNYFSVLADVPSNIFKGACIGIFNQQCEQACQGEYHKTGYCSLKLDCWCKD
ncbi:hypothetical protein Mgra_00003888 [Meloidogyne graminicola]|uniref:Knottins-like domain-containing protein n=1 Tax=Meloidogyne graminicola TaxID=189291 RepID=A0A8S9ZT39_9BILA|nr:hypothetical protein Mgra_00003888 [Meloidogyne graminicola]